MLILKSKLDFIIFHILQFEAQMTKRIIYN